MRCIKLLCTGDLHLGRVSSKCGPDHEETARYSVRHAWMTLVEQAIQQGVHLVLLSGDIADDGGNQYEAMGPFEAGMRQLAARGIHVYLVAGNHDARALPRLAALSGATVHLLGRDGAWEQATWPVDGPPQVALLGWSYPAGQRVATLPLAEIAVPPQPGVPVIGLAHTDYRTTQGEYAASSVQALRQCTAVDLWLLGHIHAPEHLPGAPAILNPGSPQALDPGEPGCHGPWLVEITDGAIARVEQLPLSTVAYETLTIDITGLTAEEEVLTRLLPALEERRNAVQRQTPSPRLSCRISLTGRTGALERLHTDRQLLLQEQPLLDTHNIYIERIELTEVGPAYDVPALCARPDMVGVLARLLQALDAPEDSPEAAVYLRGAQEVMRSVLDSAAFPADVSRAELPTADALLKAECGRLLDALLRQEEARA